MRKDVLKLLELLDEARGAHGLRFRNDDLAIARAEAASMEPDPPGVLTVPVFCQSYEFPTRFDVCWRLLESICPGRAVRMSGFDSKALTLLPGVAPIQPGRLWLERINMLSGASQSTARLCHPSCSPHLGVLMAVALYRDVVRSIASDRRENVAWTIPGLIYHAPPGPRPWGDDVGAVECVPDICYYPATEKVVLGYSPSSCSASNLFVPELVTIADATQA